ncbi:MAG: Flp pilus assembly complex ATPase component TadA [Actinobacteria bacterium]|nr:Flp pilus assembly complex ATPase component TadA [Actinomycetota bacterium]
MSGGVELERAVHERVVSLGSSGAPTAGEVRAIVRDAAPLLSTGAVEAVVAKVLARANGMGPLDPLLADAAVADVMVNGPGPVWVERAGALERTDVVLDRAELDRLVARVLAPLGLRVDRTTPMADARLPDGSRVNVVVAPLAVDGPYLTVRRFADRRIPVEGFTTPEVAELLRWMVEARWNVVVSGGAGAGKTTLLNGAGRAHPPRRSRRHHRGRGGAAPARRPRGAARSQARDRRGAGRRRGPRSGAQRVAHATRPDRRRRVPGRRGARRPAGHEHRPRGFAVDVPRQRARGRAAALRDHGAHGRERPLAGRGPRPDRRRGRRGGPRRARAGRATPGLCGRRGARAARCPRRPPPRRQPRSEGWSEPAATVPGRAGCGIHEPARGGVRWCGREGGVMAAIRAFGASAGGSGAFVSAWAAASVVASGVLATRAADAVRARAARARIRPPAPRPRGRFALDRVPGDRLRSRVRGDEEAALAGVFEDAARNLRSGASLETGLRDAASGAHPTIAALRGALHEVDRGVALAPAIDRWAADTASRAAALVADSVAVASRVGGSPARALDAVAASLRSTGAARREARAQAAQARASAFVLVTTPPLFATGVALTDDRVARVLFRTPAGLGCLAAGVALEVAGAAWMRHLAEGCA